MCKRFGHIQALDHADFEVRAGEVMALVGENGAGKSTLVKILAGLYRPDAGEVLLDGEPFDLGGVLKAEHARIAVVQQELSLVPTLTIAENVFLGSSRGRTWRSPHRLAAEAASYLERVGLGGLDPLRSIERLSVAERQLIEVARLVARDARILIFDEPTAALSEAETDGVKRVVRKLRDEGGSIIYVTHRLDEVFDLADRVTVFRDGRSQPPTAVSDLDVDELIHRMLGSRLEAMYPAHGTTRGEVVLSLEDLRGPGLAAPVGLEVRRGEIVGLAGQVGSGASALLQVVSGTVTSFGGRVRVDGKAVPPFNISAAIRMGIGYASSDRKKDGLFLGRKVSENLTAPSLHLVSRTGWVMRSRERSMGERIAALFKIDPGRLRSIAGTLSGGNQQKVAVGKWLGPEPAVLLVDEPTRGVDVGARAEIYGNLRDLAEQGMAVVFASSDVQEILGLADTIVTFFRGEMVSIRRRQDTNTATIMREITHPTHGEVGP
ncbi:MAG: sugar ABC transporter ATP-binding protein [Actinobacteria bacterium]|nr:sugar ABC transporter ATP-binding protein [Actinomycetota bacterium]